MEKIVNWLITESKSSHPVVETHTYPDNSSSVNHSMYYFEEYFGGFVIGMSNTYGDAGTTFASISTGSAAGSTDAAACFALKTTSALNWGKAFDAIFFGYLKRPFD